MTYETWTPQHFTQVNRGHSFRKIFFQIVYGPLTVTLSILLGAIVLYAFIVARGSDETAPLVAHKDQIIASNSPVSNSRALRPAASKPTAAASDPYGMLFDPSFATKLEPVALDQNLPLGPSFVSAAPPPLPLLDETESVEIAPLTDAPKLVQSIPLPTPRPQDLAALNDGQLRPSGHQVAQVKPPVAASAPPADDRSLFDKLFGLGGGSSRPLLAYAAPEDNIVRSPILSSQPRQLPYDRWTAVYDITARTVYMPNGTKLEAHSGLGDRLDDPRYVSERMRGATPPHVYELQLREQLFHGVQALRLTPIGEGDVYGRTGLLAHRYMLGPNGDSNGCVSIKDYEAFLQAYRNGDIKRLAVVARLN